MPPVAAFAAAYAVSNAAYAAGATIATQALLASAAATIASTATTFAILTGAALALRALTSSGQGTTTNNQLNLRQAIPPRMRYYGQNLTGGYWAFWQSILSTGGSPTYPSIFYGVLVTAHGESDSIVDRFLNGRKILTATDVPGFGTGWKQVATVDYKSPDAYAVVSFYNNDYLGTAAQISDPYFNSLWGTAWDSDHRLRGCTVVYLQFFSFHDPTGHSQLYPGGGLPNYTEERKCAKIYNPATTLTTYSENSALVIADFMAHRDGWGLGAGKIDWVNIQAEAAICDQTMSSLGEGTIKRYLTAGGYNLNDDRQATLTEMLASCDAIVIPRPDGKIGIRVGRWITPTYTINPASILQMQAKKYATGPGEVNIVRPTYTDRRLKYKETESKGYYESNTPPWGTPPNVEEIVSPINLLWVPHHNQAVRIAKRVLRIQKATWTISMILDQFGLLLLGERFFYLNYPLYSMSNMTFEITGWKLQRGGLSVEVSAISVDPTDWDFDYTTEEPVLPIIPADPDAA